VACRSRPRRPIGSELLRFRHRSDRFTLDQRQFGGCRRGLGRLFGRSCEKLLFLDDGRWLSGSSGLRRPRRLLRGTRSRFGDARRFDDAQCLSRSRPSHLLGGEPRSLGTARLFLATLLVATLLFFPPLGRATRFLLGGARFILCDPRLLLRGLCLRRRCVRFARRVRDRARLTADVFEELGEYTAQCIRRESTRIRCGLLGYLLLRYSRFAPRAAQRGKATSPVRCDLVDEAVALLAEPLDLFAQHLPLVTGLLEALLGGVLGAC